MKLLDVHINPLSLWYSDNRLFIGNAMQVMSPVAGVGNKPNGSGRSPAGRSSARGTRVHSEAGSSTATSLDSDGYPVGGKPDDPHQHHRCCGGRW